MALELPTPENLTLVRPSWMDPRYILATCDATVESKTLPAGEVSLLAPANPRRWAIGFGKGAGVGADVRISPTSDPANKPLHVFLNELPVWFTVFEFGPFVTRQWFGHDPAGTGVTVWEVFLIH